MAESNPSTRWIPAFITSFGNLISNNLREIGAITGTLGGLVTILNIVFGIHLVPYGTALLGILTSDGAITILLLIILMSQIMLHQRVEWILSQLESEETPDENEDQDTEKVLTDGGQPRDSKGRFTTRNSGGSNLFLLFLAAVTGYVFGAETGVIDPLAAALIAIAAIAFFQAAEG